MNPERLAQLKELVSRFRAAVIRTDPAAIDPNIARMGDPGVMCILLAQFLEKNGFPGCEMVCGSRNAAWHAWLELEGLIVDLAPDQFNEIPQLRVMPELYEDAPQGSVVTEAGKSPWHSRMEQYFREPANAALSSGSDIEAIFSAIKANFL